MEHRQDRSVPPRWRVFKQDGHGLRQENLALARDHKHGRWGEL